MSDSLSRSCATGFLGIRKVAHLIHLQRRLIPLWRIPDEHHGNQSETGNLGTIERCMANGSFILFAIPVVDLWRESGFHRKPCQR